jgi:hypothetical protein
LSEWINRIHVGHCLDILKRMPADLVDTVVTSPPYWNSVRDYGDDTGANWGDWEGQLGHEPDPLQFIEHILQVTRELKRVLKPTGSFFLNFGDGYYHGPERGWLRPKQLLGIPWRVAIAMQDEGWILRNDLVWHKCLSGSTPLLIYINGEPRVTTLKDALKIHGELHLPTPDGGKARITSIMRSRQPSAHITFRDGFEITCSRDHRFKMEDASHVEAGNLVKGLVVQKATHMLPLIKDSIFKYEWGWLIGLYLAEGSIPEADQNQVDWSLNSDELRWKDRIDALLHPFGIESTSYIYGSRLNLRAHSPLLAGIIRSFVSGDSAKTKRLTGEAWLHGPDFIRGIMDGFVDGDAHYEKINRRWRGSMTRNRGIVADLRAASFILGYRFRASESRRRCQSGVFPCVNFSLKKDLSSHHVNSKQDTEVKSVTLGKERDLYDVSIDSDDHLFCLLNGAVTHNSNAMPSSSVDKWKPSHEHVFFFTKEPNYYFDIRNILTPLSEGSLKRIDQRNALRQMGGEKQNLLRGESSDKQSLSIDVRKGLSMRSPEEGRHPEDVLSLPSHGFPGSHFSTFPEELVQPFVKAACPRMVCRTCGKPRMRMWETIAPEGGYKGTRNVGGRTDGYMTKLGDVTEIKATWKFIGWSDCGCGGGWTRGVLLDPFAGSGTALKVARRLGRNFIGIDIKKEYVQMARGRLRGEVRKTQGASRLIDFNNSNFTISVS